jgi:hypothetical protein
MIISWRAAQIASLSPEARASLRTVIVSGFAIMDTRVADPEKSSHTEEKERRHPYSVTAATASTGSIMTRARCGP